MARWFVVRDGSEHGPFTDSQLKRAALAGKVRPDDLIRREDTTTTKVALEVKGLSFAGDDPLLPDAADPEAADLSDLESATPDAAIAACLSQKEKIQNVLLPHAYANLGQRYYELIDHRPHSKTPPPEVAAFVEQIDSLLLSAPTTGGPGSQSINDPARDKAVQHRLTKKYAQLGKRAYEVGSLPQELIKEHDAIQDLIQRDRTLFERVAALRIELTKRRESEQMAAQVQRAKDAAGAVARNVQGVGVSLLYSTPIVVLLSTLIPPLGLYLIWQHPRWGIRTKVKWAGLSVAIFASLLMANHVRVAMSNAAKVSEQAKQWAIEKANDIPVLKDVAPAVLPKTAPTPPPPDERIAASPPAGDQTTTSPTPTVASVVVPAPQSAPATPTASQARQLIGTWLESRPNTPAGDRVRTFNESGECIEDLPKSGRRGTGTWNRDGDRVSFTVSYPDGENTTRWFLITREEPLRLSIRMEGEREYEWLRHTPPTTVAGAHTSSPATLSTIIGQWRGDDDGIVRTIEEGFRFTEHLPNGQLHSRGRWHNLPDGSGIEVSLDNGFTIRLTIVDSLHLKRKSQKTSLIDDSKWAIGGGRLTRVTPPIPPIARPADNTPATALDLLVAGSVWQSDDGRLTLRVTERNGNSFRAEWGERRVQGQVTANEVSWLAKDVVPGPAGDQGGDNSGVFTVDRIGPRLDFTWKRPPGPKKGSGAFTLRPIGAALPTLTSPRRP
jgi:hypothetical protein